jgi:hypothetical protein
LGDRFSEVSEAQQFLISLLLLVPVDPMYAGRMDPEVWDTELEALEKLGYALFVGASEAGARLIALIPMDDLRLVRGEEGPRRYALDLRDPYQDEIEEELRRLSRNEELRDLVESE